MNFGYVVVVCFVNSMVTWVWPWGQFHWSESESLLGEYVQGTKTVYYLLYKIEGILSTVHKIMYFMNNMLTSRDNVLPGS